jgi:ATP-dependent RNA helicase HelY
VSNAEEFGDWLGTVRGATTDVVVEEHRPVPLWQHVMVGDPPATTCSSTRLRSG